MRATTSRGIGPSRSYGIGERWRFTVGGALLILTLVGCAQRDHKRVASILTPDEIQAQLSVEPLPVRERFNASLAEKQRYVEGLLRTRALADEARRRGLDKDPLVIRRNQQVLVDRLLEKLRDESQPDSVTEAEVDAHLAHNGQARAPQKRTRVSQIVLPTRAEAEQVRAALAAVPVASREARFREEARARSLDRASAGRAGDLGYLGQGMAGVPEELGLAADALALQSDLSPPVEHEGRFVILLKTGELVPPSLPPEIARQQARASLLEAQRRRALEAIVAKADPKRALDTAFLSKLRAPVDPPPTARR